MPDVTATIQQLLMDHGVDTTLNADGWLTSNGSCPACRATMDEPQFLNGGCKLRMDVELALSHDRVIVESFADFAEDESTAFQSSLQNFCTGTLHVLLSAFWGVVDASQVTVEQLKIDGQPWTLHLGNIVRKAANGADVPPPKDLMPIFDQVIPGLQSEQCIHWGRLFYANMPNGNHIVEVLLDNQPSEIARERFAAAAWAATDYFYSQRMFWVLTPDQST